MKNSTVIVVDALRATTCIVWAVKNGAKQVIPARDENTAFAYATKMGLADTVLSGERSGSMIEGFQLSGSPQGFDSRSIWKKNVVVSSEDCTNAIDTVKNAKHILIGAMINRTAAAIRALEYGSDILIVCAGKDNRDSADDMCCAGALCEAVSRYTAVDVVPNDMALVCTLLYCNWVEGRADLSDTMNCAKLIRMGKREDVDFCLKRDMTSVVPEFVNESVIRVDKARI